MKVHVFRLAYRNKAKLNKTQVITETKYFQAICRISLQAFFMRDFYLKPKAERINSAKNLKQFCLKVF